MRNIKQAVQDLESYYVLQDETVAKLNQNESPYDVPAPIKKQIINRLQESEWNRYAALRPERLLNAIAAYTDHPIDGIIAGNGSNEMIHTMLNAFCYTGDKILVVDPGFSVYPRMASVMGVNVITVPLLDDFDFDVPSIINKANAAKLLFLAIPNAPTGTIITTEQIEEIATNISGVLVVDEAYFEFYRNSAQRLLAKHDNVVIIRTFSKAFALAGLRLGYMLAASGSAVQLEKAKLPFSVGIFQQIAGEILMKNHNSIQKIADQIISEREQMFRQMSSIKNLNVVPSHTNFILFEIKGVSASEAYQKFFDNGVLIRAFHGGRLDRYVRVTVGTPKQNNLFLDTLKLISG